MAVTTPTHSRVTMRSSRCWANVARAVRPDHGLAAAPSLAQSFKGQHWTVDRGGERWFSWRTWTVEAGAKLAVEPGAAARGQHQAHPLCPPALWMNLGACAAGRTADMLRQVKRLDLLR